VLAADPLDAGVSPGFYTTGPNGTVYIGGLEPGKYRVAAVEPDDSMLWNSVEDYAEGALQIELKPGEIVRRELKPRR